MKLRQNVTSQVSPSAFSHVHDRIIAVGRVLHSALKRSAESVLMKEEALTRGCGAVIGGLFQLLEKPLLIIVIALSGVGLSAVQGLRIEFAVIDSVTYPSSKGCTPVGSRLRMG